MARRVNKVINKKDEDLDNEQDDTTELSPAIESETDSKTPEQLEGERTAALHRKVRSDSRIIRGSICEA